MLAACSTPWIEDRGEDWRTLVATLPSNNSGNVRATVRPEPGETNMLVSFQPLEEGLSTHLRFMSVGGETPYLATDETADSNVYSRSSAAFVSEITTFNWPIEQTDGTLQTQDHRFTAGIVDAASDYVPGTTRVGVMLKADPDLSSGLLRVNLVFAGETVNDDDFVRATEDAVQVWRDIYAGIGVQLDIVRFENPNGVLQAPGEGNRAEYEELAASTRFGAVNVVLLEEIAGFAGALGFAGDIPGPLMYTPESAVAVNLTLGAGTDGRYDPRETILLGETMAHEVGHFLGLYHPVETAFTKWDALDDTEECTDSAGCIEALGTNLMFPFPVCNSAGCSPQQQVTPEQAALVHRYTGVL
jgi:hypothetical protein